MRLGDFVSTTEVAQGRRDVRPQTGTFGREADCSEDRLQTALTDLGRPSGSCVSMPKSLRPIGNPLTYHVINSGDSRDLVSWMTESADPVVES